MTEQQEVEAELMADFERRFAAHRAPPRCPICGKTLPAGWRHVPGRSGYCTSEQAGP